jgi:hypothetical protein
MNLLGMSDVAVRLTRREAIIITLFFLLIWFAGYMTGAEVTRFWEKTLGYSRLHLSTST